MVCVLFTILDTEDHLIYPIENRTITIVDKYDGSFIVIDQNDGLYYVGALQPYLILHPQHTYDVVVKMRTDPTMYPFSSGQQFQCIKEIIGEVK
jgi:hypothetical protein